MLAPLLLLLASAPDVDVRFVAGLLGAAFSTQSGVDVLTRDDFRHAIDLEAEKQGSGCDADASCLAEIAAALDARVVVYGSVDVLGDELLLQLSAFDAKAAQGLDRVVGRAATPSDLAHVAEQLATQLAQATRARIGDASIRVLVLDIDVRTQAAGRPVALWSVSAALAGGAIVVAGLGAFADFESTSLAHDANADLNLDATAARQRYVGSDTWGTVAMAAYIGGGALAAGAVVVGVAAMASE